MADVYATDLQVSARLGVHRTTPWVWAKDQDNDFPKPIRLSARCTRWKLTDIEAWEARKAALAT